MFVHYHSLFAGVIVAAVLLILRVHVSFGVVIVPVCFFVDFGQFLSRLKRVRQPWQYLAVSIIQSVVIFGLFSLIWMFLFGGTA